MVSPSPAESEHPVSKLPTEGNNTVAQAAAEVIFINFRLFISTLVFQLITAYFFGLASESSCQVENRLSFGLADVLVALLVGLDHT